MIRTGQGDEADRRISLHAALRDTALLMAPRAGVHLLASGLEVTRRDRVNEIGEDGSLPRIGIVVQGGKDLENNGMRTHCGEGACYVQPEKPAGWSPVTSAPYVSLSLRLDPRLVRMLIVESKATFGPARRRSGAIAARADCGILDAFLRLLKLADRPDQAPYLSPLIVKEIHYRALVGTLGETMRRISVDSSFLHDCSCGYRISDAVTGLLRRCWSRSR